MFFRSALVFAALILLLVGFSPVRAADLPQTSPAAFASPQAAGLLERLRPRKVIRASTPRQSGCSVYNFGFCCIPYQPTGSVCTCQGVQSTTFNNSDYCQN
jgi:hypothetical protein